MTEPCGITHPDHPEVACNVREALADHEEHLGYMQGEGVIDWPNPDFQPKARIIPQGRRPAREVAADINRQTRALDLGSAALGTGSLREAQDRLRAGLEEGVVCECCGQFAKIYKRSLSSSSARCLLTLYRAVGRGWGHLPTILSELEPDLVTAGGYAALASHWGLMEESEQQREDGGRAGWWRVTDRGESFLGGAVTIHKYVLLYNGQVLDHVGDQIDIRSSLGDTFDLRRVMAPGTP